MKFLVNYLIELVILGIVNFVVTSLKSLLNMLF